MSKRTIIWVISDGKAGHESQSLGLASAIGALTDSGLRVIRDDASSKGPLGWLFARTPTPTPDDLGPPDIVIGAGTATHALLRACKKAYGAKTIVIMRPSFGQFDLVVPPMHDAMRESWNVIPTRGAMNPIWPSDSKDSAKGLFLIGGPSKHHGWNDQELAAQIREIVDRSGDVRWTLTTSRRTPVSFIPALRQCLGDAAGRVSIHTASETTRDWLLERYAESEQIWVSEDSVSMVYEALTSGARVGLLRTPRTDRVGRVVRGMDTLVSDGWAMWFEAWQKAGALRAAPERLNEASRVAAIVVERFNLPRSGS